MWRKLKSFYKKRHPALIAIYLTAIITPLTFLPDLFSETPVNGFGNSREEMKEVLRSYFTDNLETFRGVYNFVILMPIKEELSFRGPAFLLLLVVLFYKEFLKIPAPLVLMGYAVIWFLLIALADKWANLHNHHTLTIFCCGLLWGWLMVKTKNIFYPILFHAASNAIALLAIYVGYHWII